MNSLFLVALIPLLVLPSTHAKAAVTPEQDKCIYDKMLDITNSIILGMTLHNITSAQDLNNNAVASIEECFP